MLGTVDAFRLPTNYHWPTDTADRVDYGTVADSVRFCARVIERMAEEGAEEVARSGHAAPQLLN